MSYLLEGLKHGHRLRKEKKSLVKKDSWFRNPTGKVIIQEAGKRDLTRTATTEEH